MPGNPETLVARHDGNLNATKSGIYSRTGRVLAPRVEEVARMILDASHTHDLDELGAQEIARLVVLIETVDDEIEKRGTSGPRFPADGALGHSLASFRPSRAMALQLWHDAAGARRVARELGRGTLAAEIARRRKTEK